MKALITSILIGFSLALYAQLSSAEEGFNASFLDWTHTSTYRAPSQTASPSANTPEASESSQQTPPVERPSGDTASEIALRPLHPGLSPRLAALEPGQPLLDDIQVRDEAPLEVDPEALADMGFHDLNRPVPVQAETGSTSLAASFKQWLQ
ncbi:hypothetical protein D5125_03575 [Magnetovirga frankeli]|uniref:hypothetical protein n=1 Tax=Magnetovirga frankeli TaxID=947516 RepID=UPI001293730B|nr:hypothetical protein D5125_03575 [gamma proteobacterium SS-5]